MITYTKVVLAQYKYNDLYDKNMECIEWLLIGVRPIIMTMPCVLNSEQILFILLDFNICALPMLKSCIHVCKFVSFKVSVDKDSS